MGYGKMYSGVMMAPIMAGFSDSTRMTVLSGYNRECTQEIGVSTDESLINSHRFSFGTDFAADVSLF